MQTPALGKLLLPSRGAQDERRQPPRLAWSEGGGSARALRGNAAPGDAQSRPAFRQAHGHAPIAIPPTMDLRLAALR